MKDINTPEAQAHILGLVETATRGDKNSLRKAIGKVLCFVDDVTPEEIGNFAETCDFVADHIEASIRTEDLEPLAGRFNDSGGKLSPCKGLHEALSVSTSTMLRDWKNNKFLTVFGPFGVMLAWRYAGVKSARLIWERIVGPTYELLSISPNIHTAMDQNAAEVDIAIRELGVPAVIDPDTGETFYEMTMASASPEEKKKRQDEINSLTEDETRKLISGGR